MKTKTTDQTYQTAIHEAGHAVITLVLGRKFKNVSIRGKDDYLGRIRYWANKEALLNRVQDFDISNEPLKPDTVNKRLRFSNAATTDKQEEKK